MILLALLWQSSVSPQYNLFFWCMVILCTTVATGIAAFLIFSAWKYRRKRPNELPSQVANNVPAEATWIILPLLIFFVMFFFGVKLYFHMERPPDNAEDIYVVAKQWMWKMQHMDGQREINMLHVPVGRPIRLNMISEDVIHSFFVPAFRIKQDVLPKRYTTIWFEATKPGVYHLFCAEYCGTNHSQMTGWIYALNATDYKAWQEHGGEEGSLASTGEKLFHQYACSNCHHYSGHGRAPNLVGLYGQTIELSNGSTIKADDTYLRESIVNPKAQIAYGYQDLMPTYEGQIPEDDLIALIAYIKAIGAQPLTTPAENVSEGAPAYTNNPQPLPAGSKLPNGTRPGAK